MEQYRDVIVKQYKQIHKDYHYVLPSIQIRGMTSLHLLMDLPYSKKRLDHVIKEMKQSASMWSYVRGSIRYTLAPMWLAMNTDILIYLKRYDSLIQANFPRAEETYIGALYVEDEAHAVRASQYYTKMKQTFPILTTPDDIPFAVLLMSDREDVDEVVHIVKQYVNEMKSNGWKKSNETLWVAQLLAMHVGSFDSSWIERMQYYADRCYQLGLREKRQRYVIYALMAVAQFTSQQVTDTYNLYELLKKEKGFQTYRHFTLLIAYQMIFNETSEQLEVAVFTAIQAVLSSQQTAMTTMIVTT